MKEIWRNIPGYDGVYKISNLGNVRSTDRYVNSSRGKRLVKGSILRPTNNGHGYLIIGLASQGHKKNHYIHRLVAQCFLENALNLPVVNHIDRNTRNNAVDNLEWCTTKENINHSIINLRKPKSKAKTTTGHKYINLRNGRYRLNMKGVTDRSFLTLAEALSAREVLLDGKKYIAYPEEMSCV